MDTVTWELWIDAEHLQSIMCKLEEWKHWSSASIGDIASLHRHLSFITRVVKPGWIFLHRVIEEMQHADRMDDQVQLSTEFQTELDWWQRLLPDWNGISAIPEFQWTSNVDFELFMDASGSGFGAFWQGAWFTGEFTNWAHGEGMAFKELFAITMAVVTWGNQWHGKKTRFFAICFISRIPRTTI